MHTDPLFTQGLIVCAIGGAVYCVMMVVILLKAGGKGLPKNPNNPNSGPRPEYWLEDDTPPSRNNPGLSNPPKPSSNGTEKITLHNPPKE